jgi:CRISPR-associated protein Cas4
MGNDVSSNLPEDWATVDMVNRFTFCPRLFHLMYVEGRWEENEYTIEGKAIHRRVDRIEQILPETVALEKPKVDDGDASPEIARSVSLSADDLGLMGKLDLVSCDQEGGEAIPVETKRGRVPAVPLRSYPPERVQVMAQGLLLGRHGYQSNHGYLYFAGSRTRVRVDFDEELEQQTLAIIAAVREGRAATVMPPPLEDSPKCWGCSLCGICLPDETHELRRDHEAEEMPVDLGSDPRRLYPARAIGGPRHRRPALALDFMEPFRPILADSVVITAINTGMVKPRDFITNTNGCAMQPAAKKALLRAWEQRLDQLHTHSEFGYRCSWRTILRIQARLLVRLLRGDIPHLPWPVVR